MKSIRFLVEMKIHYYLLLLIFFNINLLNAQNIHLPSQSLKNMSTPFEINKNATATYHEAIAFYEKLASQFSQLELKKYGMTDAGHPLHVAILSMDGDFDPESIRKKGKQILMINNAIHPGEPCGVDATMMWYRDLLQQKEKQKFLANTVLIAIPIYNIGGALNRNSTTRANQNGPESYGFRGNAKNLDLNRDFIKCDSRNAQTFNRIFNDWQPHVFVDNHTSNGADYQYTMTLIATQKDKLDKNLGVYLEKNMLPRLYEGMKVRNWEMIPYVYAREKPDDGIAGFLDLPRYSSGYAALHHTISFMPETHMLKPYVDRVQSTYAFMDLMLQIMDEDHSILVKSKQAAINNYKTQEQFELNWELDRSQSENILFKGYEAAYKPSEISGKNRLYYDRTKPFEKEIPYLNNYKKNLSINKPMAYLIPQAYQEIIERLEWNGVAIKRLAKDQEIEAEFYRIGKVETGNSPYEGHFLHRNVEVTKEELRWKFFKGDYVIMMDQATNRYVVETLEPQAPDSFFAWNFFDGILAQKEYFSSYVFEDLAAEYLKQDPELQKRLASKKEKDKDFAASASAQLEFIYRNSPHYEPTPTVSCCSIFRGWK